jgi:type VI secretion system secreted protein VgrG
VSTPLGPDAFQLTRLTGEEALSQLFVFKLDLVAESESVPFESIVGQEVTAHLEVPGRAPRHFSGICNRFSQGSRTMYHAEILPSVWLLTRTTRSRIFQDLSVPDILERVFQGRNVTFQLAGNYQPRAYCIQYRESDFDFASRLMEDEGIWYFFRHESGGHTLVVADTPQAHPAVGDPLVYDARGEPRLGQPEVFAFEKTAELRSGKYTLRDYDFEVPSNALQAQATIQQTVQVGSVVHHLALPVNRDLELYDYPGGYAERFDGVDPGGGSRPGEIAKLIADAARTVQLRMQEEAATGLTLAGASVYPGLVAGYRFALTRHFDGNGEYVLTSVRHSASLPAGGGGGLEYSNSFTCIPAGLPFRPQRTTPVPVIPGPQTAFVVGPTGQEIFSDKYGRVKVQFHWDREGRRDANSSCWIRVAQPFAGGALVLPRIGWEVVVAFDEGDPDRPVILGRVYNADDPPPDGDR